MFISIGNVKFENECKIVATVDKKYDIKKLLDLKNYNVSFLELRLDLISDSFDECISYINLIKENLDYPLIATLRETKNNKDIRFKLFKKIIPLVDVVDIEIESDFCFDISTYAKQHQTFVIVSYHNFKDTPDDDGLKDILNKSITSGADIIKIAAMANSQDDIANLLSFCHKNKNMNIVAISMGDIGSISRIIAPIFGSILTYGYIENSVAPGQLSVYEIFKKFKEIPTKLVN